MVSPSLDGRLRVPVLFHRNMVRCYRRIRGAFKPDVVHVHSSAGALVRRWERFLPVVTTVHAVPCSADGPSKRGVGRRALERLETVATRCELRCVWRWSDRIVVVSPKVLLDIEQLLPSVDRRRVRQIPPGLDLETFRPASRSRARRTLDWGDEPVLLFVGRLTRGKRVRQLLEILAAVRTAVGDARAVIVGEGGEMKALREAAIDLAVEEATTFVGAVPHQRLVEYYNAADVFVNPTGENETFGMALGEAMACGTPVLVSTEGAATGVVPPRGASIYRTVPEACELALRLLQDPDAGRESSEMGRRHVERYGADRTARELLDVYERVVAVGRRSVPSFGAHVPGFITARMLEGGLGWLRHVGDWRGGQGRTDGVRQVRNPRLGRATAEYHGGGSTDAR